MEKPDHTRIVTLSGVADNEYIVDAAPSYGEALKSEIYGFLDFDGMPGDRIAAGRALRRQVLRWLGLPTSVGFAATKTLAKLANHVAKTAERKPGSYARALAQVCDFSTLGPDALDAIAPLLQLLWLSLHNDTAALHWGLGQYLQFLTDPFSLSVLGSTLLLGAEVTAVCLVLGFPIAWLYQRVGPRLQTIIILIVLLPLLTSVVVRTFAWIVILGRQGISNAILQSLGIIDTPLKLLYTQFGVVIALAQVQMPLMTLPLITALGRIDSNLDDASCSLGAGSWRTFFKIVLPLSLPGVIAGCTLTYAAAITAFITQSLIGGGQMLFMPMYLYQQASTLQNWPFASAISIIFLLAVLAVVSVFTTLGRMSRGYGGA
jgi:putative spermidine/putrescine transport system permease protein